MTDYRAPLGEIDFLLKEVFASEQHYDGLAGCEPLPPDLLDAIVRGAAEFAEQVVAPLLRVGDEQGCRFENGTVCTPDGFAEAFRLYGEGGWQGLTAPAAEGGQGLPPSLGLMVSELMGSGNWAWSMYTGLALAPVNCLLNAGTPEQKATYLPKLLSGEWGGTMCLTEAHCGSDVGLIRSKAEPQPDGSYRLTGTKIFVSGGEQDITDNIVHSVLGRVDGAPAGTKGLSLFIVPKFAVAPDGSLGERNGVECGSIEHKMGLKGSATCVIHFDGATATRIGEENRGLEVMFEMMNTARLGTALQGVSLGELAFQLALAYARDREQMRSLTGPKNPDGEADPILVHPDVRRMLLTQKAFVEGSRALIYWLGQLLDQSEFGAEPARSEASRTLELLTPIAKAFCTETCQEVTNQGLQVFGGHGYIADNGIEQVVRDARISTVYEGTTGIQALDLIGRKVLANGGVLVQQVAGAIREWCAEPRVEQAGLGELASATIALADEWETLADALRERAIANLEELGACSVDFLMYSGYAVYAYLWLRMALAAHEGREQGRVSDEFCEAKLATARFYFGRLAPRAAAHRDAALAGADSLMSVSSNGFGR